MASKVKLIGIGFAAVVSLVGCSGGTYSCSDSEVKEIVTSIILQEVRNTVWGKEVLNDGSLDDFEVTRIKTSEYDENLDQYTCNASFSFEFKGKESQQQIVYVNSYLEEEGDTEVAVYDVDGIKNNIMTTVAVSLRN